MYRVKAIAPFYDMENEINRSPNHNEEFIVSETRLKTLQGDNYLKAKFIEVLEEVTIKEDIEIANIGDMPTEEEKQDILSVNNIFETIEEAKQELKPRKKK